MVSARCRPTTSVVSRCRRQSWHIFPSISSKHNAFDSGCRCEGLLKHMTIFTRQYTSNDVMSLCVHYVNDLLIASITVVILLTQPYVWNKREQRISYMGIDKLDLNGNPINEVAIQRCRYIVVKRRLKGSTAVKGCVELSSCELNRTPLLASLEAN